MGNKGLRDRGCVFSAPKMLIIINQHENSAATKQSRVEGDERPTGSVLGGLMVNGTEVEESKEALRGHILSFGR